ncbi:hypothetical protein [Aureimonas phyllosphaerae]|uniref:NO-binding membrane sensor protein with MHYT domain n=1 Tax=Aureimonas phyllosphaerae TaxID=1166078 RepID=A0A7W6BUW2_9HYPH|nr:hypothetical protein [Aureimonas phyllosphaerae]MBB3936489.1 NO-binding membrane sensor protein with MHYT domain [Aureimonas phyllosphaerae]MBB3960647.1 NO-binding membrane sensor protein with MHYT domain [Aureimonas phyllosphaerae]SFF29562.1 hypothetical protein SAMN05216566_10757 [Aureimonas phyllosphaerae]
MSASVLSANPSRRRSRAATAPAGEALKPARGIMLGLGISAMIWTGIGALIFG